MEYYLTVETVDPKTGVWATRSSRGGLTPDQAEERLRQDCEWYHAQGFDVRWEISPRCGVPADVRSGYSAA